MKKLIIIALIAVSFSGVTMASNSDGTGQMYLDCSIKSNSDGTGQKSNSDGTGQKSNSDGTGQKSNSDGTGQQYFECMKRNLIIQMLDSSDI